MSAEISKFNGAVFFSGPTNRWAYYDYSRMAFSLQASTPIGNSMTRILPLVCMMDALFSIVVKT